MSETYIKRNLSHAMEPPEGYTLMWDNYRLHGTGLAELFQLCFPGTKFDEPYPLARQDLTLVLIYQCKVVGTASGKLVDGAAHLNWVAVHPDHRGKGLGRLLCRHIVLYYLALGLDSIYVTMNPPKPESRALYASLGFEPMEELE